MKDRELTYTGAVPCLKEDFFNESDISKTQVVLIPKHHLFGAQPKEAYSARTRRKVEKMLRADENQGYFDLLKNPSIVVPVFTGNKAYISITDGHHRARYVDRMTVPSRIVPVELATEIYNRNSSKQISVEEFKDDLFASIAYTLKSFDSMDERKYPDPVTASNVNEIVGMFEQIPNFGSTMHPDVPLYIREVNEILSKRP